jgi:aqualysin 1
VRLSKRVGAATVAILAGVVLAGVTASVPAAAAFQTYIVVLDDSVANPAAAAAAEGVTPTFVYKSALKGYAAPMTAATATRLASTSNVRSVEPDGVVHATITQTPATWGLDRIDQRNLPLNNAYTYTATGAGVTAYIIDTGIRFTHTQFGGRASSGVDEIDGGPADDCNGHGTHVSGTVGGTTYGVAKAVSLVAVRVLDCNGSGSFSQVIAGIDWVTANHQPGQPAVANMSLGGGYYAPLNTAVSNSIADGVTYAVAAGNDNANACGYSPASTPNALTIGATTSSDARSSFSNWGSCLDLFAPGSGITSSYNCSDTCTAVLSGTSMATPHTAGAAALYLQGNPGATPAQVSAAIINNATPGVVGNPGTGSPNRLLYTGTGAPPPPGGPTISSFTPTSGPVGTIVTVYGSGFSGVTSVKFNGTSAAFQVSSPTRLYAQVPGGATTGPISVTTGAGTGSSASSFTVIGGGGGAPVVSSFSPTSGPVGTIVSVYGTNFVGTTAVKFNGVSAQFLVISSTKLYAKVPAGAATGKISVTTPGGTGTSATNFNVT